MEAYSEFLQTKRIEAPAAGVEIHGAALNPSLFGFQRDLVRWALRKGRAAIFADTGLGKTLMQLEWASRAASRSLILAPLAVAKQTVKMAERFGYQVTYVRGEADAPHEGIVITNYEMLSRFDVEGIEDRFGAVVLDESSILKSFEGKTRTRLIETFKSIPMRLCCTATPAPNDIAEIANHAEFLGLMTRVEMLSCFFVHDDKGWRLKGHAREPFYRWLASWGMSVKKPSDLGYSDEGFELPPLTISPLFVQTDYKPEGMLFAAQLKGITERTLVRKATLPQRVAQAVEIISAEPDEPWLIWCGLNDESKAFKALLSEAVEVKGADSIEHKESSLLGFADGSIRILITKASIAGFGMNWQHCARMLFIGMGDSYEQYYQAIRRCWRFGQTREVKVHIVLSDAEYSIYENVMSKEREAMQTGDELIKNVAQYEQAEIGAGNGSTFDYQTREETGDGWRLMLGDSSERLAELPDAGIDLSVFSPPFAHLYTYSNSERDLGNAKDYDEFFNHLGFVTTQLARVMRPGRNVCVHVQQIALQKAKDGVIGLRDFRGDVINHYTSAGFVYHGEICIDKDPQAQAIRTHSKSLLFVQLRKDASWMRPALADYILVFRAPGENTTPIQPDLTNDEWIEWARPIWYGIKESDTLNVVEARANDDERHICPLQLGTIERCIRLWSNKGETVLSPFAGIGSEGYQSLLLGRQFIGCELKPEYFKVAVKNLTLAEQERDRDTLFSRVELVAQQGAAL